MALKRMNASEFSTNLTLSGGLRGNQQRSRACGGNFAKYEIRNTKYEIRKT